MKDVKVQDAIAGSWVDRLAPLAWRPYLRLSRLDRPVGAWLLFLPCVFGGLLGAMGSGAEVRTVLHVMIVCALGSWLMRGAGCTWNDIVDRKIDAQVERTRSRPLPAGQVSVKQALIWMVAQMLVAALGLLTFDWNVIAFTLGSLVIVAIYPFAKRFTNWPQLVLGLCFNWGALVAWMQITGSLSLRAFALYLAMIFWTLFYDTIYAYQDVDDDAMIGVKSSARTLGSDPKRALGGMLVMMAGCLLIAGGGWVIWITKLMFMGWLVRDLLRLDPKDGAQCLEIFRSNVRYGQFMAIGWMVIYGCIWLTR